MDWLIVMMFYALDGTLHLQVRKGLQNEQVCAQSLPRDLAEFRRQFGNAQGVCIKAPEKPEGLPEPKPVGVDA